MSTRLIDHGFLTVATVSPKLHLANVCANVEFIESAAKRAADEGAALILFPELALTAYSCADLFYQETLLTQARAALDRLAAFTKTINAAIIVGLPLSIQGRLYNTAAFLANGRIVGIVPKTFVPNTGEFYEKRWFTSGKVWTGGDTVMLNGAEIPFGTDLLFQAENMRECVVGIEICEDLWAVEPPSGAQALAGATLICNPSAGNELIEKAAYRRALVTQQSARCIAAYAYANAGSNESSSDLVFSGHSLIAKNGILIAESERFSFDDAMIISQVDIRRLLHERRLSSTWFSSPAKPFRRLMFTIDTPAKSSPKLRRRISQTPFVPADPTKRDEVCLETFAIQTTALARRIRHLNTKTLTLGVSGGLDSTLALLVCVEAFDRLGFDRKGIHALTMSGPGSSMRTKENAQQLIRQLGVSTREISIHAALRQHLADIGHPEDKFDATYENAQARERTQILLDYACKTGGFVVGTGDLSEIALGWCTFNADHMSMYHINAGIPKTLLSHLIGWFAATRSLGDLQNVLRDIAATPYSPELLPPAADGSISQETEKLVGPYELHDFFLYHFIRAGSNPKKILFQAEHAFAGKYDTETLVHWLRIGIKRFFAQQYKRNAMPDGPKVGTVALSPRGDWRMPADAGADLWLKELE